MICLLLLTTLVIVRGSPYGDYNNDRNKSLTTTDTVFRNDTVTYVTDINENVRIYSGASIDLTASPWLMNASVHRSHSRRPIRNINQLPDIYYVTPRGNRTLSKFPEYTVNNVTYKHVDITDDIMTWGLNQNIHLTDYLENTPGAHLVINIKDRVNIYPFQYKLSPNRVVVFLVDNDRLKRYFKSERNSLLQLALSVDPDDHELMQQLYYRLGSVLDTNEQLRRSFMRKIVNNLVRNRVSPIDLTLDKLERELSDAQVNEFALRQLRVDDMNDLPIMDGHRRTTNRFALSPVSLSLSSSSSPSSSLQR